MKKSIVGINQNQLQGARIYFTGFDDKAYNVKRNGTN